MTDSLTINLRHVARGMSIPLRQIQATVQLLEEGNTVPFITRYRKDETGGLDEVQISLILSKLAKLKLLSERKQTILRTIENQGRLTPELEEKINQAGTMKRLEDLYLPFKQKKQTLATAARNRGLEPLAAEILAGAESCRDLEARAAEFVDAEKELPTVAEVLAGAGHILAEQFSENAELRQQLRDVMQRSAKIVTTRIETEGKSKGVQAPAEKAEVSGEEWPVVSDQWSEGLSEAENGLEAENIPVTEEVLEEFSSEVVSEMEISDETEKSEESEEVSLPAETAQTAEAEKFAESEISSETDADSGTEVSAEPAAETAASPEGSAETAASPDAAVSPKKSQKEKAKDLKEAKRKKEEERKQKAFQDYFAFEEAVRKMPPHRVLAMNRGEQAKVLRVKVETDHAAMAVTAEKVLLPKGHAHADFLKNCVKDALQRLVMPALEREVRRELTEHAENHAVEVFAKNLRNLLLQSPVHDRKVLAVDPGFKNGCKLAALDQFGNVLAHGVIYLIGKSERLEEAKKSVLEMIKKFQLSVIAIGNGTACRAAEDFFANLISVELADQGVEYVIVNEAGASVYSASVLGREEFPEYDAVLRGAISIGRRLQDPLSELVKIDPANIGVGLYQHDVKGKHLRQSLENVVESCVNFVGVDVNMASPALLRFVSGLNQLSARKIYEHRRANGPFKNRMQLKDVPGIGDATFVQAAGFLKIARGDNPLDTTWIHPESYDLAVKVLEKLGVEPAAVKNAPAEFAAKVAELDVLALAKELETGEWKLKDILAQLVRPGRDPREDLPAPVFKKGVLKLEDLTPGLELTGTVLNVVDFGAFVDIGLHDSGLVHVSQMADKFVREPHEVVAVGDSVKVWVVGVDKNRHRVSLTMIDPSAPVSVVSSRGGSASVETEGKEEEEGTGKKRSRRRRNRGKRAEEAVAEKKPSLVVGGDISSPVAPLPVGLRLVSEAPENFVPRSEMRRSAPRKPEEERPEREKMDHPARPDRPPREPRAERGERPEREKSPPRSESRETGGDEKHFGRERRTDRVSTPRKNMEKYQYKKDSQKPVMPITEDMKKGTAPMRSFGDLAQFFDGDSVTEED